MVCLELRNAALVVVPEVVGLAREEAEEALDPEEEEGDDLEAEIVENTDAVHNVVVCTLCSCYPWSVLWREADNSEHVAAIVGCTRTMSQRLGWLAATLVPRVDGRAALQGFVGQAVELMQRYGISQIPVVADGEAALEQRQTGGKSN